MKKITNLLAKACFIGSLFLFIVYGASLERMIQLAVTIILVIITMEDI